MSKEAMKLALEALEEPHPGVRTNFTDALKYREKIKQAITALREALVEQPAQQEPVTIEHCLWARNGNTPCPHTTPQPAPVYVPGVVLRDGQPTLVKDRDIKSTDVRLCVFKENT